MRLNRLNNVGEWLLSLPTMTHELIPVAITRNEDRTSSTHVLGDCPVCGDEYIRYTTWFSEDWNPQEPTTCECEECGATFELCAKVVEE